ncbi:MAG: hypothetical protein MUF34_06540 [Polyangiaceae bacterium]|nr:hypothetical protein [Polyangiaceae bacterium]
MNTTDTRDLEQVLARTVRQFGEVQTRGLKEKLPRPFQRPEAELKAVLGALADRGEIFRHPTAKTKFLAFDSAAAVRNLLIETVGPKALTEAELKKQVAKRGASLGLAKALGPLTGDALQALVNEGTAFVHRAPPPPEGTTSRAPKTLRYASVPPPPPELRPYVRRAAREVRALIKTLAPFGATVADALRAFAVELGLSPPTLHAPPARQPATTPEKAAEARVSAPLPNANVGRTEPSHGNGSADATERLLRALDEVAAREPPGSLLLVEKVRARAGLDKQAFDQAALALAGAERVVLHYHDHPASLPAAELAEFVDDGNGTYFIGIARRRGS